MGLTARASPLDKLPPLPLGSDTMANIHGLDADAAIKTIRSKLPETLHRPIFGIVCGSGLSGLGDSLRDKVIVPYSEIPGFSQSSGISAILIYI